MEIWTLTAEEVARAVGEFAVRKYRNVEGTFHFSVTSLASGGAEIKVYDDPPKVEEVAGLVEEAKRRGGLATAVVPAPPGKLRYISRPRSH